MSNLDFGGKKLIELANLSTRNNIIWLIFDQTFGLDQT